MTETRSLEVRLADYRDAMAFLAPQLQDLIDHLPAGSDIAELESAMKR